MLETVIMTARKNGAGGMVDQPHLPGDIRSPMTAQPRHVYHPARAAVPAPGTVPVGGAAPPIRPPKHNLRLQGVQGLRIDLGGPLNVQSLDNQFFV